MPAIAVASSMLRVASVSGTCRLTTSLVDSSSGSAWRSAPAHAG